MIEPVFTHISNGFAIIVVVEIYVHGGCRKKVETTLARFGDLFYHRGMTHQVLQNLYTAPDFYTASGFCTVLAAYHQFLRCIKFLRSIKFLHAHSIRFCTASGKAVCVVFNISLRLYH